jgi:hypothetical protein
MKILIFVSFLGLAFSAYAYDEDVHVNDTSVNRSTMGTGINRNGTTAEPVYQQQRMEDSSHMRKKSPTTTPSSTSTPPSATPVPRRGI